jgi:hypothetical protein
MRQLRERRAGFVVRIAAVSTPLVLGPSGACSGDSDEEALRLASLSEGCLINTDCNAPLVCAFRRCHQECRNSSDCPEGQRCVASDRPFHVCQLDDERECAYSSQCPSSQVCAVDGECRDQCAADRDCVAGQLCAQGACAEPDELEDGKLPVEEDAGPAGQPCSYNSDCAGTLVCKSGVCVVECKQDRDCAPGLACVDGRCAPPGAGGAGGEGGAGGQAGSSGSGGATDASAGCFYNSDCTAPGEICVAGACKCECQGDVDCSSGEVCDGCGCVPDVPDGAPGSYGKDCVLPSDCTGGLVCLAGRCGYECNEDLDCAAAGICCRQHQCVTGAACGAPDAGGDAADAAFDGGCGCLANDDCDDGVWCNGDERCVAGCCQPALDTPCDSHNGCMQDTCFEATQDCDHAPIVPMDLDGDGHLHPSCGGDDCDDDDATSFLGALERCDGADNDCNGVIDDRSRLPFGPLMSLPPVASGDQIQLGAVVPFGAGWLAGWVLNPSVGAPELYVRGFDAAGAPASAALSANTGAAVFVANLRAASGGGTAVFAFSHGGLQATSYRHRAIVYGGTPAAPSVVADLQVSSQTTSSFFIDFDVTWAGSDYVVGWRGDGSAQHLAKIGRLSPTGGLSGVVTPPTPDGSGVLASSTAFGFGVAASGATSAAIYAPSNPTTPHVSIFATNGSLIAGPIELATGVVYPVAIAGVPGGYVALWNGGQQLHARFIGTDGTLGAQVDPPVGEAPFPGDGASDAQGALFALNYEGLTRFLYTTGDLTKPIEVSDAILKFTGLTTNYEVNVAGDGTRFGVSSASPNEEELRWVSAGCQ